MKNAIKIKLIYALKLFYILLKPGFPEWTISWNF